jgi:hypothetical protein
MEPASLSLHIAEIDFMSGTRSKHIDVEKLDMLILSPMS